MRGEASSDHPPSPPKPPKDATKLVRVGSKLYSKDTHVERQFNVGLRVEKAPGGIAFRTQNELVSTKERTYKRLPTYPGEQAKETRPPTPIPEKEEE